MRIRRGIVIAAASALVLAGGGTAAAAAISARVARGQLWSHSGRLVKHSYQWQSRVRGVASGVRVVRQASKDMRFRCARALGDDDAQRACQQ